MYLFIRANVYGDDSPAMNTIIYYFLCSGTNTNFRLVRRPAVLQSNYARSLRPERDGRLLVFVVGVAESVPVSGDSPEGIAVCPGK